MEIERIEVLLVAGIVVIVAMIIWYIYIHRRRKIKPIISSAYDEGWD